MPSGPEVDRHLRSAIRPVVAPTPLYFHAAPWLVDQLTLLSERLMTRVHLDHRLADLIGVVVSRDNSCRYCFAAQRAILRLLGFSEQQITRLEHDLMLADLSPAVKAALEYARRISRETVWYQTPRLQQRAREVRDRLERPEFVEAIGVTSLANVVCRLGAALAPLSSAR